MKIFVTLFTMFLLAAPQMGLCQSLIDIQAATLQIQNKERELNEKEQTLNAREERLNALERDLITREENLSQMRKEISALVDQVTIGSNAELDSLARLYTQTRPKAAASVLVNLELQKSAAILRRIQPMTAGKILAEMAKQDAEYTAKLTAMMAGGASEQVNTIIRQ